jgi:hypothetical protein
MPTPRLRTTAAILCFAVLGGLSAHAATIGTKARTGTTSFLTHPSTYSSPFVDSSSSKGFAHGQLFAAAGIGSLQVDLDWQVPKTAPIYGTVYMRAGAYFADTITINAPGMTGQAGTAKVRFTLDGPLFAAGHYSDSVRAAYSFGTDPVGDGTISDSLFVYSHNGYDATGFNPGSVGLFQGTLIENSINFTFGTPFDMFLAIETSAQIINSTNPGDYDGRPGTFSAHLALTYFSGITDIRSNDVPVSSASAPGTSGAEWTTVPEPASVGMIGIGAALLLGRRRRK